jgi:hypothetical protein
MTLKLGGGQAYDLSSDYAPLYHKRSKLDMICFAKPGLTGDLYIVHKEEFSVSCYMYTKRTLDKGEVKPLHKRQTQHLVRQVVT